MAAGYLIDDLVYFCDVVENVVEVLAGLLLVAEVRTAAKQFSADGNAIV